MTLNKQSVVKYKIIDIDDDSGRISVELLFNDKRASDSQEQDIL